MATMIKLNHIAGAGLLLLAAGCTQTQVVASNYDAQVTQFLNQPESTVVASWGPPSVQSRLSTGGDALVWVVLDQTGASVPGAAVNVACSPLTFQSPTKPH